LGRVAHWRGDLARAVALYEAALALARAHDDRNSIAWVLASLGRAVHLGGDPARASALLEESRALHAELNNDGGVSTALHALGLATADQGDRSRASVHLRASLAIRWRLAARLGIAESIEGLAMVAIGGAAGPTTRRAALVEAVTLLGSADAMRAAIGAPAPPADRPGLAAALGLARAHLSTAAFAAAWAEGQHRPLGEVVAVALNADTLTQAVGAAGATPATEAPAGLTPREREVLALLARGLSNRAIAAELSVGVRTVETHVANILGKLGLASRVEVAAWVAERRLMVD
jgi:non-specific serine/threonine protein kinase